MTDLKAMPIALILVIYLITLHITAYGIQHRFQTVPSPHR